jgi:hypothetical protein
LISEIIIGNQETRKRKELETKLFSSVPGFLASELISEIRIRKPRKQEKTNLETKLLPSSWLPGF